MASHLVDIHVRPWGVMRYKASFETYILTYKRYKKVKQSKSCVVRTEQGPQSNTVNEHINNIVTKCNKETCKILI